MASFDESKVKELLDLLKQARDLSKEKCYDVEVLNHTVKSRR